MLAMVQGQLGWDFGQPEQVKDASAYGREFGLDYS